MPGCVRHGIDEAVHPVPARAQLRVLAAARIDRERFAAEGVATPRRRTGPPALTTIRAEIVSRSDAASRPSGRGIAARAPRRQEERVFRAADAAQRSHERLGLDDAAWSATTAPRPRATCGSRARTNAASTISSPSTPLAVRVRRSDSSVRESRRRRAATMSLPHRACGTSCVAQNAVQPARALDAEARLQRAARIVDAGVDDAAVVGARLHPRPGMLIDTTNSQATGCQLGGCGQARNSAADDENVEDFDGVYDDTGRTRVESALCRNRKGGLTTADDIPVLIGDVVRVEEVHSR